MYFLDMRINDKKSVCIRSCNRHDVCCAPVTTRYLYDGSIRTYIWVFILSVLGRSNVLLRPPDPNFINLLTQYLAKFDELHQRVS